MENGFQNAQRTIRMQSNVLWNVQLPSCLSKVHERNTWTMVPKMGKETWKKLHGRHVMAYFDLSSCLYLSRLIHDVSLIIPKLSVLPDRLYRLYVRTRACINAYWTYLLSRYSATILLNACTRVSATYLPIPYGCSHAHSPSWSTHSESYPSLYL